MFLSLLDKFEKEVEGHGVRVSPSLHDARFEFALWLEKNAAQHGVNADGACAHLRTITMPSGKLFCVVCQSYI